MRVLHAGCGNDPLPKDIMGFGDCEEVRLDVDDTFKPDIQASITDMGDIGTFDAAYMSHALEHLYPHEVPIALAEFRRVIRPGGHFICLVPDLEGVQPTGDVVYTCDGGVEITGLHMYYGDAALIPTMPYMAHHCGFVKETLQAVFEAAGYGVTILRLPTVHSLMAIAKRI